MNHWTPDAFPTDTQWVTALHRLAECDAWPHLHEWFKHVQLHNLLTTAPGDHARMDSLLFELRGVKALQTAVSNVVSTNLGSIDGRAKRPQKSPETLAGTGTGTGAGKPAKAGKRST